MDLNIKKFEQHMQEKQQKHNDTFIYILNKCKGKMELALSKGHKGVYYEVPEFIIGKPVYKLNDCLKFIIMSLSNGGFSIKYYFPRVIHVSWENIKINYQPLSLPAPPSPPPPPPPQTSNSKQNSDFTHRVQKNKNKKLTLTM